MQIKTKNKQVNLREYKLILDATKLAGTSADLDLILKVLEDQLDNQELQFEKSVDEPKVKQVWFLDNKNHDLYKQYNFIIRVKERTKDNDKLEFDVTFKVRTSKRNSLDGFDLFTLNPEIHFKLEEQKFEEDIVADLTSKFSISTELEFKDNLDLSTLEKVLRIFPNLTLSNIKDVELFSVNDLRVIETSYRLGKILYQDGKKAEVGYSIWINPIKSNFPIIGEFDIDVKVDDLSSNDQTGKDKFRDPSVDQISELFKRLQRNPIVDKVNTTKTEFVYKYKG